MRWTWIEGFLLSQTILAAMLFLPGITPIRPLLRIGSYVMGVVAWGWIEWRHNSTGDARSFPARPWLIFAIGWLTLSIAHPNSYSLVTAVGQVLLYLTVMSPAFWAGKVVETPRQISRLMAVLFLTNALSATLGLGQVFYPERLNPPVIPAMSGAFGGEDMIYEAADGRKIMRPCGLTDSPGAAAPAGAAACLIGLCWALRPIAIWKRLACTALSFASVMVIYYTQVRSSLIMLGLCLVLLTVLQTLQGNVRNALALASGGAIMVVGSLFWVARTLGNRLIDRFAPIVSGDAGGFYYNSRGAYVEEALGRIVWEYPLGYGLGWYGMIYATFRDPMRQSLVWAEVMISAWIFDGGILLLVAYGGALVAAVYDSLRIALTTPDRELAFWATVVVAFNLSIVANCFTYVTFLSSIGPQFWLLSAALHAADARCRSTFRRPSKAGRRGPRGAPAR
ncbi:MAG: hypothetical protein NVSMB9_30180 [Isosphaeraceae bacterium]